MDREGVIGIRIGKAIKEIVEAEGVISLILGDVVEGCSGSTCWIVVDPVNGDGEGVGVGGVTSIGDLVGDFDDLRLAGSKGVVGRIGWVEFPGAIGIDG